MHGIVLLGAPGSGKGTQAVRLSREMGLPHVSSGELFRESMQEGTELGRLARTYIDRGELVPDEVTVGMVEERITQPDCVNGFILDGFPRTLPQADALEAALAKNGRCITCVPYIRVRERMLMERLSHRWTCRDCGAVFAYESLPPRIGCKKDICDGELYQRSDDNSETQKRRLQVYLEQTAPLIGYYWAKKVLVEINGEYQIEYVYGLLHKSVLAAKQC
jgi:adenylate kinase